MRIILLIVFSVLLFQSDLQAQDKQDKSSARSRAGDPTDDKPNAPRRKGKQMRLQPRAMFARLDTNRDKVITVAELPKRFKRSMEWVDSDGDEKITYAELSSAVREHRQRFREMLQGDQRKGKKDKSRLGKKGEIPNADEMMRALDVNGDAVLTEDEIPSRLKKKFSEIDKSGDDKLDIKELVSLVERLKAAKESKGNRYESDPDKSKGVTPKRPPRSDG